MAVGAVLLAGLAVVLAVGMFGSEAMRASIAEGGIACVFLELTGIDCPFCGITHATLALAGGNLGAAFSAHPVAPVVLGAYVWASVQLMRNRMPAIAGRAVTMPMILAATGVVWALNLAL